jgi:ribosomal protein S18 acetylase RimI-like enzyme
MICEYCGKDVVYKCCVCGKPVCAEHARLGTICHSCEKETTVEYAVGRVTSNEKKETQELVKRFWGEEEQLTFGRVFGVVELPSYVARTKGRIVGFVSFTDFNDALLIVALAVEPDCQGSGVGASLIKKVETEGKRLGKKVLVSTSNDDLPALAFYQSLGFQIFEVKPNAVAEKHGKIIQGIGGLPVRDELRLQKTLQ